MVHDKNLPDTFESSITETAFWARAMENKTQY